MGDHHVDVPVKGFKVTNGSRKRMVGIACSSLQELKNKACQKFQVRKELIKISTDAKNVSVLLCDGTVVDDEQYFKTLPNQSVLIIRRPGDKVIDGVDIIYGALKSFNLELLETASKVRQFFDVDAQKKIRLLSEYFRREDDTRRASLSRRSEDPEWFQDLETLAQTKEEYMRKRSGGRIQRYLYDAKDKVANSYLYRNDTYAKRCLDFVFKDFFDRLRRDQFFGCYFDRSSREMAMCDGCGLFVCQGIWNRNTCSYVAEDVQSDHRINPYVSKELRVLFSTWNLDHRIERSRSIIPSLLKAAEICCRNPTYRINSAYFYDLFFGTKNLKLVHIVCHDKNEHKSATCDSTRLVIQDTYHAKNQNKFRPVLGNSVDYVPFKRSRRLLK